MTRETAEEVVAKLHHNSPRIVGAEKAIGIIQKQYTQEMERRGALEDPEPEGEISGPGL